MTTNELIAKLRELDPTGGKTIRCWNEDLTEFKPVNIITECEHGEGSLHLYSDTHTGYVPEEPLYVHDDWDCDQCNIVMINKVLCHERGCPNARRSKKVEDENQD